MMKMIKDETLTNDNVIVLFHFVALSLIQDQIRYIKYRTTGSV